VNDAERQAFQRGYVIGVETAVNAHDELIEAVILAEYHLHYTAIPEVNRTVHQHVERALRAVRDLRLNGLHDELALLDLEEAIGS